MDTTKMTSTERNYYLKYYQGKKAHCLDPCNIGMGIIEQVDIEDGSVLIKIGERSTWTEGKYIMPHCKSFSQLETHDLHNLIDHLVYNNIKLNHLDFDVLNRTEGAVILQKRGYEYYITIYHNWGIMIQSDVSMLGRCPDNYPELVFLMIELGYELIKF